MADPEIFSGGSRRGAWEGFPSSGDVVKGCHPEKNWTTKMLLYELEHLLVVNFNFITSSFEGIFKETMNSNFSHL